eukprot:scaffold578_cov50-Attheya_sp.AAC.3
MGWKTSRQNVYLHKGARNSHDVESWKETYKWSVPAVFSPFFKKKLVDRQNTKTTMAKNSAGTGSPNDDDDDDDDDGRGEDVYWVELHRRTCQERRAFGATPRQVYAHLLKEANSNETDPPSLTTVQSKLAHCLDDSSGHPLGLAVSPPAPTPSSTHPTSSSSTFSFLSPTKQSQPTMNHSTSSHNDDDNPSRWLVPHVVPLLDSSSSSFTTSMNPLQTQQQSQQQQENDELLRQQQPTVYYRMASASWGLTKKTVGVLGKWVLGDDEDEDLVATNVTDLTYTPPPASTSIPKDILDADTVVWNIGWIVECCQCILQYAHTYSQQQESQSPQNEDPFYRMNRHDTGGGPVILLDRHGTGPDS